MRELYTHPNVGTVLLLSLGCEGFNRFGLEQHIKKSERPVEIIVIQENEGTPQSIAKGRRWVEGGYRSNASATGCECFSESTCSGYHLWVL